MSLNKQVFMIINFFITYSHSSFTTLLVYIDDIILTINDDQEISSIKQALDDSFSIKFLREL